MAILTLKPLSEADGFFRRPTDSHAKFRYLYFKVVNGAVAGDDGSFIELGNLPPGAVRIFPLLSAVRCSAFGAARAMEIGLRAYKSIDGSINDVVEDPAAFSTGLSVVAAGNITAPFGVTIKFDIYSKGGVRVFASITGGTIPAAAELEGYLTYGYE